jgi:carbon storage regulator
MLVLTRKENERLIIDERIVITIVRVAGTAVRLGIEAPLEVPIRREELGRAGDKCPRDEGLACLPGGHAHEGGHDGSQVPDAFGIEAADHR